MKAHPDAIRHQTFNLFGNKSKFLITQPGYLIYARLSSTSGDLVATLYTNPIMGSALQSPLTRLSTTADSLISERNPDAPDIPCPEGILVSTTASADTQEALLEISYVDKANYLAAYPEIMAKNKEAWNAAPGRSNTTFGTGLRSKTTVATWAEGSVTANSRLVEFDGNAIGYRITETTHTRVTT